MSRFSQQRNIRESLGRSNQRTDRSAVNEGKYGYSPKFGGGETTFDTDQMQSFQKRLAEVSRAKEKADREEASKASTMGADDRDEKRDANAIERFIGNIYKTYGQSSNYKTPDFLGKLQEGDILGAGADLAVDVIGSSMPSMITGVPQAYEAITGARVTEMDDDGKIPDREISPGGRLAQAANAYINIGGDLIGAEADLAKGAWNKATSKFGGEMAEKAAKNAARETSQGAASYILGNMASEGIEEASQNIYEDIRYERFDPVDSFVNAMYAGAVGAAGGGLMGAGAYALNRSALKSGGRNATVDVDPIQDAQSQYDRIKPKNTDGELLPSVKKDLQDRQTQNASDTHASKAFTATTADRDLDLDQAMLGTDDVYDMWYSSDDQSQKWIARMLDSDIKTLDNLFTQDRQIWRDGIKKMAEDAYHKRGDSNRFFVGRSPATKGGGVFDADLVGLFDGRGIMTNSMMWSALGGDTDGDKANVYFQQVPSNGYVSQRLINPVTGKTPLTWSLLHIAKQSDADIRNAIESALAPFALDNGNLSKEQRDDIDKFIKDYQNAVSNAIDNDGGYDDVAKAIDWMNQRSHRYASELRKAGKKVGADARSVPVSFIRFIQSSDSAVSARLKAKQYFQGIVGTASVTNTVNTRPDGSKMFESRGRLGSHTMPVQEFEKLGYMLWNLVDGNPLWRQLGAMSFRAKSVQVVVDGLAAAATGKHTDIAEQLIQVAMRMRKSGGAVENSMESAFRLLVLADMKANSNLFTVKVSTEADLNELMDVFVDAYNSYVKAFNDAQKGLEVARTEADAAPINIIQKNEINKNDPESVKHAFLMMFGDMTAESIFDMDSEPDFYGLSINQIMEKMSGRNMNYGGYFANADESMSSFFNDLKKLYLSKKHVMKVAYESNIREICEIIGHLDDKIKRGELTSLDRYTLEAFVNGLVQMIDPKAAFDAGFGSVEAVINKANQNSPLVRELLSGDAKRVMNAMCAISIYGQYQKDIKDLTSKGRNNSSKRDRARSNIAAMGNVSPIHEIISRELLTNDSKSKVLNVILDMDISFDEKYVQFNELLDFKGCDFFVDVMTTKESSFTGSEFNQKRRDSNISFKAALQAAYEADAADIDVLESKIDTLGMQENDLYTSLKTLGNEAYVSYSMDVFGIMIHDAATMATSKVEKGVAEKSSIARILTLELLINGGASPMTSIITGDTLGIRSVDDVVSNRKILVALFSDPDFEIEVYDPRTMKNKRINRTWLFQQVSESYDGSRPPTNNEVLSLLKKYPQLASWLSPGYAQPLVSSGEVSVSNRQKRSLSGAVEAFWIGERAFQKGDKNLAYSIEERERRETRAITAMRALNNNSFMALVTRAIKDLDSNLSVSASTKAAKNVVYELTDYFRYCAMHDEQSTLLDDMQRDIDDMLFNQVQSQMRSSISKINSRLQSRRRLAESAEKMRSESLKMISDLTYTLHMASELEKVGVDTTDYKKGPRARRALIEQTEKKKRALFDQEEALKKIDQLVSMLSVFSENSMARATSNVRESTREQAKRFISSAVDKNGNPLSEEVKARLLDEADTYVSPQRDNSDVSATIFATNNVLMMSDLEVSNADINKTISKLDSIAKFCDVEITDQQRNEVRKLIEDGNNTRDTSWYKSARSLIDTWGKRSIGRQMKDISYDAFTTFNGNLAGAVVETRNTIQECISDARKALRAQGYIGGDVVKEERPKLNLEFNFTDPVTEAVASYTKLASTGGAAPVRVSVNGGAAKRINQAFSLLPSDHNCSGGLKLVDLASLSPEKRNKLIGYKKYDHQYNPGDKLIDSYIVEVTAEDVDPNNNQAIWVFDPEDCHGGLCEHHSPVFSSWPGGNMSYVLEALGQLGDFTQEQMALKLKKTIGVLRCAVQEIELDSSMPTGNIKYKNSQTVADNRVDMWNHFLEYRRKYSDHVAAYFKSDELKGLGYNEKQAYAIARLLVVGVTLEFSDGSKILVTGEQMADPNNNVLETKIQEKAATGVIPVGYRAMPVSLEQMAARINLAVSNMVDKEGGVKKLTANQISTTAMKAACDWSDYEFDTLTADEMFSRMAPLGAAYKPFIEGEDAPAKLSAFYDLVSDGELSVTMPSENVVADRSAGYLDQHIIEDIKTLQRRNKIYPIDVFDDENGAMFGIEANIDSNGQRRFIFSDNPRLLITSVVYKEQDRMTEAERSFSSLASGFNGKMATSGNVILVATNDEETIARAVNQAMRTDAKILVRASQKQSKQLFNYRKEGTFFIEAPGAPDTETIGDRTVSGYHYELFDPTQEELLTKGGYDGSQSKDLIMDPDSINIAVVNDGVFFSNMSEAGVIYNAETMGKKTMPYSDRIEFGTQDLFDSHAPIAETRPATNSDLAEFKKLADAGDWSWIDDSYYAKRDSYSLELFRRKVMSFLEWATNGTDNVNARTTASKGDCIAIVLREDGGLKVAAPVIMPGNTANDMTIVRTDLDDGVISVWFDSSIHVTSLIEVNPTKTGTGIIPNKGMGVGVAADRMPRINGVSQTNGTVRDRVDAVVDDEAISSRLVGSEIPLDQNNLYLGSRLRGFNAFLVYDKRKNAYRLNRNLSKLLADGYINEGDIVDLFNGYISVNDPNNIFYKFLFGGINIFDSYADNPNDTTDNLANDVMRHVILQYVHGKDGIDIRSLFMTYIPDVSGDVSRKVAYGFSESDMKPACKDINITMYTGDMLTNDKLLIFYNTLDKGIVKAYDDVDDPNATMFSKSGEIFTEVQDPTTNEVKLVPKKVVLFTDEMLGKNVEMTNYGGTAARSMQGQARSGMSNSLTDREARNLATMASINSGSGKFIDTSSARPRSKNEMGMIDWQKWVEQAIDIDELPFMTDSEREYQEKVTAMGDTFATSCALVAENGDIIYGPDDPKYGAVIQDAMDKVNAALPDLPNLSYRALNMLYMYDVSHTKNDGRGIQTGYLNQFLDSMDRLRDNLIAIRNGESGATIPIRAYSTRRGTQDGRHPLCLLHPSLAKLFWESDTIKKRNQNDFDTFVNNMIREDTEVCGQLQGIVKDGSRISQLMLHDWAFNQYGKPTPSGHIAGFVYASDLINGSNQVMNALFLVPYRAKYAKQYREDAKRVADRLGKIADETKNLRFMSVESSTVRGGYKKSRMENVMDGICRGLSMAESAAQICGVASPGVIMGNMADRLINQGNMATALAIGRNIKFGPYSTTHKIDADIVNAFANNPEVRRFFELRKQAIYLGSSLEMIDGIKNTRDMEMYVANLQKQRGGKWGQKAFWIAGGGNIGLTQEIKNFIYDFVAVSERMGHDWWFEKAQGVAVDENGDRVENEHTLIETQLINDPIAFMLEVSGANNSPSLFAGQMALNESMKCDMAAENTATLLLAWATRRVPAARFIVTTCVNKYFGYSTNKTGRVLGHFLPVSSTYYLITKALAQTKIGQEAGLDLAQFYPNLQTAMEADFMHLGMTPILMSALMAFLATMFPGLIEPPEDKDKWGNPDEWLFMGQQMALDWELTDTFAMTKGYMLFFRSCDLGQPRYDLLISGMIDGLYNTPLMDASDAITAIMDPSQNPFSPDNEEYLQVKEDFADAEGGAPTFAWWLLGNGAAAMGNWVSQFFTPSFVREYGAMVSQTERSVNKKWEESPTGKITEDGMYGATQATSWFDSVVRRVTRNNPLLGFALDIVLRPNTGYLEWEMPEVQIPDSAHVESAEYFSLRDADGNPLPIQEQEQKIMMAIAMLQSYDDMEELYRTGFYLDYETKQAVGDTVWDIYYDLQQEEYELEQQGLYDYNYYGDFNTGQKIVAEMRAYYDSMQQYWYNFYYDKLMSEPMRRGMQMYNRYKTTYATDDNGQIYATGLRREGIWPVMFGGGTIEDPGSTAGYENDWASISAVTGQAMNDRALFPVDAGTDYETIPSLESHARGGEGKNYSNRWIGDQYGFLAEDGIDSILEKFGIDPDSLGSGGSSYGGGYRRYGYSRRGGGGGSGGGYSPNLYSRLPNVYLPDARTMYAERVYSPNYDYLRPNFETKGSREAYKRSDI